MTAVWIGVGVVGWFLLAVGVGVGVGCAIRASQSQDCGPDWGCDCCQDEAEEIAALEALWAAS